MVKWSQCWGTLYYTVITTCHLKVFSSLTEFHSNKNAFNTLSLKTWQTNWLSLKCSVSQIVWQGRHALNSALTCWHRKRESTFIPPCMDKDVEMLANLLEAQIYSFFLFFILCFILLCAGDSHSLVERIIQRWTVWNIEHTWQENQNLKMQFTNTTFLDKVLMNSVWFNVNY